MHMMNHERSFFCESILPGLLALSKIIKFIEFMCGMVEEHTTHSLEDSAKILECNVATLREEAYHYENASLETFKKLGAYGIQIIETKVTLNKMMIHDKHRWKNIEIWSAQKPKTWDDRLLALVLYSSYLATSYNYNKRYLLVFVCTNK
ncbi:MAG: hypothetical protein EXX96DRAFT_537600 [Benjaminiella poitrasii]|nr:MAG: hypothetical protein EXX96DRAFT_537600 [Benjaminiella poitrasii]